jgi:hypothetical protein
MNAGHTMPNAAIDGDAMTKLAHWLRSHGGIRLRPQDPRRLLAERYPAGLLSAAELDAMAVFFTVRRC